MKAQAGWTGTLALLLVGGLLALGVASAVMAGRGGQTREIPCRVLPNGLVSVVPELGAACPLRPLDTVHAVQWSRRGERRWGTASDLTRALAEADDVVAVGVRRDGVRVWSDVVPVLRRPEQRVARVAGALAMSLALLSIPLLVCGSSPSPAAMPFALVYAAVAGLVFCATSGLRSAWLDRLEGVALVLLPCALGHLALSFPLPPRIVSRVPGLVRLPYACGLVCLPVMFSALERDGLLWPALCYLLLAAASACWLCILGACAFAARESEGVLERFRARLLLCGTLLLPLPPSLFLLGHSAQGRHAAAQCLLAAVSIAPLPLGLAISRYHLLDLGGDARRWSARLAHYAVAGLAGTALFGIWQAMAPDPSDPTASLALFAAFGVCAGVADFVRCGALGQIERLVSPRERRLAVLRRDYRHSLPELRSEAEVAERLASLLASAIGCPSGAVFERNRENWTPLYGFGTPPPVTRDVATRASRVIDDQPLVALGRASETPGSDVQWLRRHRLEVAAALRCRGELVGLVVLSERPAGPVTRVDLEFVADCCAESAVALANARLAEELLESERHAAVGQQALRLAHEAGKELEWIRTLARRLPSRWSQPERALRDLDVVGQMAEELCQSLRAFVRSVATRRDLPEANVPLADLVDRCVRQVSRRHPWPRIVSTLDSGAWDAPVRRDLRHALLNLLDNAVRARPGTEAVQLSASREGASLRICIRDFGPGLDEAALRRAVEPGFTTRAALGGCGVGVSIAHEVTAALGGSLRLERGEGSGLRAVLVIPCS